MSAKWEIQVALYDVLENDSTFMNLIANRLYDEPPTNLKYPYVQFGQGVEIDDNTHCKVGFDVLMPISIYTKPFGLGAYQGDNILKEINRLLNVKKFTLTNYNMIICKLDNCIWERDGDKRIIDITYRILAQTK